MYACPPMQHQVTLLCHHGQTNPSPVWSPHTKKARCLEIRESLTTTDNNLLDSSLVTIPHTASGVSNMLNTLNLSDLSYRRSKASIIKP